MELNNFLKLIAAESLTGTAKETSMIGALCDIIGEHPYFKEHPDLFGVYDLPTDHLGRKIVWALHKASDGNMESQCAGGSGEKKGIPTIVLAGHTDVVSVDCYNDLQEFAFQPEALEAQLKAQVSGDRPMAFPLKDWTVEDLESGRWLFGRGTADMKGGLTANLEETLKGAKDKNLLFVGVPDEETYSVGMRGAANLLLELKKKYNLDYKLMLMGESHLRDERGSVYFDGTIGKMTVNIIVRGIPSHVRFYYGACNAILLAAKIAAAIDGNAALTERYLTEVTPPPSVSYFRDTKPRYDVTLAESVNMSLVQFLYMKSPAERIHDIVEICKAVAAETKDHIGEQYRLWKGDYGVNVTPLEQPTEVLTYVQLKDKVAEMMGDGFKAWYEAQVAAVVEERRAGTCTMNDATNKIVHALLNAWMPSMPVVVVALAPPMYPGFKNADICGEDDQVMTLTEKICQFCRDELGYDAYFEHYFGGISDMSYAGCIYGPEESAAVGENMPLWGECYDIDFDAIRRLQIPVYNIGPFGRDIHTAQERVNVRSLTEENPTLLRFIIENIK